VPPEWAFGWGHYKDGVSSIDDWVEIAHKYTDSLMPLDHLWLSVDYTQNFEAFTVSEQKYPKLKETI
jgi:alpha-glucosidase (family GH31 glycosyl hydrolase)